MTASDFQVNVETVFNNIPIPLSIDLTGSGYASYQAESNGRLTLSELENKDFKIAALLGGSPILKETPINEIAWFGSAQQPSGALNYHCQAGELQLSIPASTPSQKSRSVTLTRVNP